MSEDQLMESAVTAGHALDTLFAMADREAGHHFTAEWAETATDEKLVDALIVSCLQSAETGRSDYSAETLVLRELLLKRLVATDEVAGYPVVAEGGAE